MSEIGHAALWRAADTPRGAQRLAEALLPPPVYAHVRGVAQQAARAAVAAGLDAPLRARLLALAWLHDIGIVSADAFTPVGGARMLRAAGVERMARMVAHRGAASYEAALRGLAPVEAEFPRPLGDDWWATRLLDVAIVCTSQQGAPASPAGRLRSIVGAVGPKDPAVVTTVWLVDALGRDPATRTLVAHLSDLGRAAA